MKHMSNVDELHMHIFVESLYSSVAERQSCKLKALGSIPSGGSVAVWPTVTQVQLPLREQQLFDQREHGGSSSCLQRIHSHFPIGGQVGLGHR